ncbi:hypothetical protein A7U60_g4098 [Sanghuangporus baumii]|uniref:Uncharacterized protein n=1 Tax=Sanghuangporus baumii TaxID=108892 RepID=A0A9Q5HZX4_SANBA|nr:hypothetical protein A7U60_g4098 [Sanghuangporus baumii]
MSETLPRALTPVTPKRSDSLALPPSFAIPIVDRYSRWRNGTHSPSLDTRGARSSHRKLENLVLPGLKVQGDAGDGETRRSTKRRSNRSAANGPQALKRSLTLNNPSQSDEEETLIPSPTVDDEGVDDWTSYSNPAALRHPAASICFAAYDAGTATGVRAENNAFGFQKLSLNQELYRQKRIVLEYKENEMSTWRFVPNARWEQGVDGEGEWPRVVEFCGQYATLMQDEWDLLKLDKEYECLVRRPPFLTKIVKRPPQSPAPGSSMTSNPPLSNTQPPSTPTPNPKRRISGSVLSRRCSGSNSVGQRKKARPFIDECSSSSESDTIREDDAEEDEVSEMVVDEDSSSRHYKISERLRKVRANKDEARRKRREATKARLERSGQFYNEEEDMMSWSECPPPEEVQTSPRQPQPGSSPFAKRKVECFSDDGNGPFERSTDDENPRFKVYEWSGYSKRTRTVSPSVCRRTAEAKRMKRIQIRQAEKDRRKEARSKEMFDRVMQAIYEDAAKSFPLPDADAPSTSMQPQFFPYQAPSESCGGHTNAESAHSQHHPPENDEAPSSAGTETFPSSSQSTFYQSRSEQSSQETLVDREGNARRVAIEESRRKIAELERDRPLWEEQARKRAAEEAEEKARAEAARKARAAKQTADAERIRVEEDASRRKAEEEQGAKETKFAELREKRRRVKDAADREVRVLMTRHWDSSVALDRYLKLSEAFEALRFSDGDVIVFETVPWPVLMRPGTYAVEDIDWTSVEAFFLRIRPFLSTSDYQKLVEKSHKRFHPDRWRSRRVLHCIEDEEERECLEAAAITVSQALTPIWQDVTGRH